MRVALAGDWTITPNVSLREDYSDNIRLAPDGEGESDRVTEVNPGLSIHGKGGRLTLDFDYTLQALLHQRNSDQDSTNHQLQANASAELIRQMIFVDATASASLENISSQGPVATSNISISDNVDTVYTYSISPYFKHHFGQYADSEVRYNFNGVMNGGTSDSFSQQVNMTLNSGRYFPRIPWNVSYSQQRIDNDQGPSTDFKSVNLGLRYVVNRKYSAFVNMGRDFNDFQSTQQDQDGITWNVGVTWTPSQRTTLDLGYGKQFFGSSLTLDLNHRSRRTVWNASYHEDITTTRDLQLERTLFPLVDPFGNPIVDAGTGRIVAIPVDIPRQTDETLVTKRFQGGVAFQGRRVTASLDIYDDRRQFQVSGDEEEVYGLSASLNRKVSPRTTGSLSGSWQKTKAAQDAGETVIWNVGLTLSRSFARGISANLDYHHARNNAPGASSDYRENQVAASVTVSF